ncbi:MarR family transcriptional regulator [Candidatus Saccharibacteria bacterium]|jgi:transcriptional regulator, MarR family|nr:MarR family transcriptional regulator [Candidatus Saccharibacteria bacterium]
MKVEAKSGAQPQRQVCIENITSYLFQLKQRLARAQRQTDQQFGLAPVHWHVLGLLHSGAIETMGDVAAKLCVSKGAATQILDVLVAKQLVQRTPDQHDRRVVRLQLTTQSQQITDHFQQYMAETVADLFAVLSDAELAQLDQLIDKVVQSQKAERA